jgi:hypothetical protein
VNTIESHNESSSMSLGKLLIVVALSFGLMVPSAFAQVNVNLGAQASSSQNGGTIRVNADGSVGAQTERSGLKENGAGVEIRASADVVTDDDLDAYEENLLVVNSSIADADSSNKRVAVSYWHEGKFLGIFKVRVESRTNAEIGEEDVLTVRTDVPWWAFLVFGLGNVEGDVQYELMSNGQFSADVLDTDNAFARARALEVIISAHAKVAGNK